MSKSLKAFGDIGQLDGIEVIKHQIDYSRLPLSAQTFKSYKEIKKLIMQEKFDLIHCHTPVASILTRLAARKSRKMGTKVIYTAHGFHFFKGASLINWLIYFPVEWICSFFTDVLITINQEDYFLAKNTMNSNYIEYIPGVGVDTIKHKNIEVDVAAKRQELNIPKDAIVLLSVGELSKRKNHEAIIRAISRIDSKDIYYLICGEGSLNIYLHKLVEKLNLKSRIIFAGFRTDILSIYKISDIFVFPSYQEGLPVALMEAMSMGLPTICSNIRGNRDLMKNEQKKYLFEVNDVDGIADKIVYLISNEAERIKNSSDNLKMIQQYDRKLVDKRMFEIYANGIIRPI